MQRFSGNAIFLWENAKIEWFQSIEMLIKKKYSCHQILFSNAASVGSVYFKLTNKIYFTQKINDFFFFYILICKVSVRFWDI